MAQTQFRSDDTVKWWLGFGDATDGAYSSAGNATDAPVDSACTGTSGTTSLSATNASFTNGEPILIHQTQGTGAGNWELNQISSYTAGTITTVGALKNSYATGAQVIQLKQYLSFTQNSGHTLTAKAWNGTVGGIIAFLCKGTVTITGNINSIGTQGLDNQLQVNLAAGGSGGGFRGGDADFTSPATNTKQGEGYPGLGGNSTDGSKNGNGGGCGKVGGGGGGGGNGGAGQTSPGYAINCVGGDAVGNAGLTSMFFGGGGGGGSGEWGNSCGGSGGSGGGIILIMCKTYTNDGGGLYAYGGRGGNISTGTDGWAAGGGGAGGSVLIKGMDVSLGTSKVNAAGGDGGTSGSSNPRPGGYGGAGRIHIDYSISLSGTTTPSLDSTNDLTITDAKSGALFFAQY